MKLYPALLVALLVISACAGAGVLPGGATTSTSGDPSVIGTTTELVTTTSTTPTTVPAGPPVAWIAPSGVPVAVIEANGDAVEVLTACGATTVLIEGTPIHEVDVVIDPGHGGPIDTGAVGSNGLTEKDINLRLSNAVHDLLTERGVASVLTRVGDYPVPIRTRTTYADLVGAEALVSIHHNAPMMPSSDIPGTEIFVQSDTPLSARLGGLLYDHALAALSEFDVDWVSAPDAGVMTVVNSEGEDAYGLVRRPESPSALIELGYIANPAEAELFADPEYVPAVATALADAIEIFLTTEDEGSPLVEGRVFDPASGVGADQCIEPDLVSALYPNVIDATVSGTGGSYTFDVTISSPYDTPERYADAFRIIGDDGTIYGTRELTHDHANEQPFTRSLVGVEIPGSVETILIEGRDQVYGWGGGVVELTLP